MQQRPDISEASEVTTPVARPDNANPPGKLNKPRLHRIDITGEDRRVAGLTVGAILLSLVDAAVPMPLPGIKPGLANIIILLVLYREGWRTAVWVNALRIAAASVALGQLLTPGFFLALAGACASMLAMALAHRLPARWFGPVTVSLCGALAHIVGQFVLVRLWLIPHNGVFALLPVFLGSAVLFGAINGLVTAWLLRQPSMLRPEDEQADAQG